MFENVDFCTGLKNKYKPLIMVHPTTVEIKLPEIELADDDDLISW